MKIINILIAVAISLSLGSCSHFLEKEPYTLVPETYFNNESELQTFLTGVYSPLMQEHFYGNYYPTYNAGGDDLSFFQRSSPTSSILCANANSSNQYITTYWRVLYEGINRANILLENADRNADIAKATRDRIKAEALFLRSFYYFNLVQGWGDVPLRIESTKSVYNLDAARANKQVVYDQLINDIVLALPHLRKSDELTYTGAVTQSAAKGILARIYLFRAGEHFRDKKAPGAEVQQYFAQAKRWALEVKESMLHGLVDDYKRVFIDLAEDKYNSTGVRESIWEIEEAGNRSTPEHASGRIGNQLGFGTTVDFSSVEAFKNAGGLINPGYSYRFIFASLKLYNLYEAENDIERGNWNIAPYEYIHATAAPRPITSIRFFYGKNTDGLTSMGGLPVEEMTATASDVNKTRCVAKYRREHEVVLPKNKNYTPINFPVLRYSDILLMIAEADNEINNDPTPLAYECIDLVRQRAKIAPLTGTGLSKEQFREAIKKERAMEFCFEATRRWDLIRWGDFVKNMTDMQDLVSNSGWSNNHKYAVNYYKISEAYNYFPIPDSEMATNKLITENNPGW